MKTAIFGLLLFASNVRAQIDSNSVLMLHSSRLCGGCTITIVARNMTPPYTDTQTVYQSGMACLPADTSMRLMALSIDSNRKVIRGLEFTASAIHANSTFPCLDGSAWVSSRIHVYFDSLPYRDSAGRIVASGIRGNSPQL